MIYKPYARDLFFGDFPPLVFSRVIEWSNIFFCHETRHARGRKLNGVWPAEEITEDTADQGMQIPQLRAVVDRKHVFVNETGPFFREDGGDNTVTVQEASQSDVGYGIRYPATAPVDSTTYNVVVQNHLTVINVRQLNVNIINDGCGGRDDGDRRSCSRGHDRGERSRGSAFGDLKADAAGKTLGSDSGTTEKDPERIYWDRWKEHVKRRRSAAAASIETEKVRGTNADRCERIDSFLSKIQEQLLNVDRPKKTRGPCVVAVPGCGTRATTTARDRQRAKIEDQKILLERQRREIDRLKLKQLQLESEKAMLENREILNRTLGRGPDRKRSRVKQAPLPTVATAVATRPAGPADILSRMEARALDRRAKWEAVRERQRAAEQEERRKRDELEERKLKERAEQKRKRLFEARENLRLKRIDECKRQAERDAWRENARTADDFRRQTLIRNGLEAFRENLKHARSRMRDAVNYHDKKALGECFSKWRFLANNSANEKVFLAEQFYKRKLMQTVFLSFYKVLIINLCLHT